MLRQGLIVVFVLSLLTLSACSGGRAVLQATKSAIAAERVAAAGAIKSAAGRAFARSGEKAAARVIAGSGEKAAARVITRSGEKAAGRAIVRSGEKATAERGLGTVAENKVMAGRVSYLEAADTRFTNTLNDRLTRISNDEGVELTRLQDQLGLSPTSVRLYDARGNLVSNSSLGAQLSDQTMVLEFTDLLIRECLKDAFKRLPKKASARDLENAIVEGLSAISKAKPVSPPEKWLSYDVQSFDLSIRLPAVGKLQFKEAKLNLKKALRKLIYLIGGAATLDQGTKLIQITRDKIYSFLHDIDSENKIDYLKTPSGNKIDYLKAPSDNKVDANIKTPSENKKDANN